MHIIVKARTSDRSWYRDDETVFQEKITVPENGLVDFVVPSSKVPQTAKSLSLEVSSFGLCIGYNPSYSHG